MNRLRLPGAKVAVDICHLLFPSKTCTLRRAPLPVWGNLQSPGLISRPATPVAFSIEREVSFVSYNLLSSLKLPIDFNVYLWTEKREGEGRAKQTNKQNRASAPSVCSTRSCRDRWQGLSECIKARVGSNASGLRLKHKSIPFSSLFSLLFPPLSK